MDYGNCEGQDIVGNKRFELSNHLGNVLAVITDRKWSVDDGVYNTTTGIRTSTIPDGKIDYYTADVISYSDYYPYGMLMDGRHGNASDYRYGFQGQLIDDEVKGEGNSVNYKYRMHDPRIGRFFAVDPLAPKYPEWTPYAFSGNQVTVYAELEGLEPEARLDEGGNAIPEEIGNVRAGVPGTDASNNNSWRAYRWEKTGANSEGWVDLGELWIVDKYNGDQVPRSSEVLPNGLSNVKISPFGSDGYQLDAFTLKSGESYKRAERTGGGSGTIGFWNATGGMYSGIFNSDGSYAGDRFQSRKLQSYYHKYAFNVEISDDLWNDYMIDAAKGLGSDLLEGLLYRNMEGPFNPFASSDNYLDKQIKAYLMMQGPGSYLQMPTGMGYFHGTHPNAGGSVLREYWFIGYGGEDYKPIFKIVDIPFEESLYGKPRQFAGN